MRLTQREHERVFTRLQGEDVALCLPEARVPDTGLEDYSACA